MDIDRLPTRIIFAAQSFAPERSCISVIVHLQVAACSTATQCSSRREIRVQIVLLAASVIPGLSRGGIL
jgi:hypothetical protein